MLGTSIDRLPDDAGGDLLGEVERHAAKSDTSNAPLRSQ
jgi:hypothetical protein